MSLSHNQLPGIMIPLNMRSVESLDMHRKIAGTVMACLQISEEEVVAAEEEAMRLEVEEEELVVAIKTPYRSSKAHYLNLNLSPHHSPYSCLHSSLYSSLNHSSPNHSRQI